MASFLILLAVYQGEDYLQEQLDSLSRQTADEIHVLASLDGSDDGSPQILTRAKQNWTKGTFLIVDGPQNGVECNFRSLILNTSIDADYYAFCDQDDIWDDDKLERAISFHRGMKSNKPNIYGSRTTIADKSGQPYDLSPIFSKPASFRNALVQSIAGGNTMVLNKSAHNLLREATKKTNFVSHDWWAYQIITGAGGVFHYDVEPHISYRQHGDNLVGSNNSARDRLHRMKKALNGRMKIWSQKNISALQKCEDLLTPAARATLSEFKIAHESNSVITRLRALRRSGVFRQTVFGQISLHIACILRLL